MLDAENVLYQRPFMSEIIGGFGFHEKFSLWLQLMYNNLKFRVKLNRKILNP